MFDVGWSELLLIGIVALIAIGPKELPGALRTLGQWMGKVRRMASEFQSQFHEAMREAELADLKKEVDEMATKAQSYTHFDPIEDIRKDIENAAGPPPALDTLSETPVPQAASESGAATPPPPASEPAPAAAVPAEPASAPANDAAAPPTQNAAPSPTPDAGRAA